MKLFLLLLILAMCGCGAPRVTSETPVTESQVRAYEASFYWAKQKGIRLDAVVFAPGFVTGTSGNETPGKATAWALCDHYAIGWNEEHIEIPGYVPRTPEQRTHQSEMMRLAHARPDVAARFRAAYDNPERSAKISAARRRCA
jgi:hypothetical protein